MSTVPFIIAELSANHNGSLSRALDTVKAAAKAGADAIKLQTYTADTLTIACDADPFLINAGTLWDGRTLYDLYDKAHTPWGWHADLQACAAEQGLEFFSTPFDATAVDFLEDLNVPRYKIASFELVDLPLLRKVASTGKPVIMSTGMGTVEEIQEAVETLRAHGCKDVTLLKCTSAYPADTKDANLDALQDMRERFGCPVGLSDHSMGITVPVVATALGASVIEKHFTLSRSEGGADAAFSLCPDEFADMVQAVRAAASARGMVHYGGTTGDAGNRIFRKSLFVVEDVKAGERFTPRNLRCIRPGHGLHPRYYETVIGMQATEDLPRGTPLRMEMVRDLGVGD